jgi:hypothetical protein
MPKPRSTSGLQRSKRKGTAELFGDSGCVAIPKIYLTPEYIQQVKAQGLLLLVALCAAYDEGAHRHGLTNGWCAIPDEHLKAWLGHKSVEPIRKARQRLIEAQPAFFEEFRVGTPGRAFEYKLRRVGVQDRVRMPPRTVAMQTQRYRDDPYGAEFPTAEREQAGGSGLPGEPGDPSELNALTPCNVDSRLADPLATALSYFDRGWSVIPVKQGMKQAAVKWQKYQGVLPSQKQIFKWWQQFRHANVAVITGRVSGLVVVDLDGDTAAARQWFTDRGIDLPPPHVRTPRGEHIYFRHPGVDVSSKVDWVLESEFASDIRGDGGYVVAPPSVHPSGTMYRQVNPFEDLEHMPPALLGMLSKNHRAPGVTRRRHISQDRIDRVLRAVDVPSVFDGCGIDWTSESGVQRRGRCPFGAHEDSTPSFSANAETGLWKCFGCKRSGNLIQLVQELNGLTFPEAFNRLAKGASIEAAEPCDVSEAA